MRTTAPFIGLAALAMAGCATAPHRPVEPAAMTGPPSRRALPAPSVPMVTVRPAEIEPSWKPTRGISSRWSSIVIHHSGTSDGNAWSLHRYHRTPLSQGGRGLDELGYHFVISKPPTAKEFRVEVGPRWHKQKHGAHCGDGQSWYNDHGIGICLVGDFRDAPPSGDQMAKLAALTRFLMYECNIPASRVRTHASLGTQANCPGDHFSLNDLMQIVNHPSRPDRGPHIANAAD